MAGHWDSPPTPEELAAAKAAPSVFDAPPTEEEMRAAAPHETTSGGEATWRGALRGASGHFGAKLASLAAPAFESAFHAVDPSYEPLPPDRARAATQAYEDNRNALAQGEHPALSAVGEGVGMAPALIAAGSALAPFKAAQGAGALARAGASAGNAVLGGRVIRGVTAAGDSKADGVGGALGDAASAALDPKGIALDAALGGGGSLLVSAAKKVPGVSDYLKSLAERRALKALGINKGDFERFQENPGGVQQAGRDLLNEGVVSPLASKKEMYRRLAEKLNSTGQGLGATTRAADEVLGPGAVNRSQLADTLHREVVQPLSTNPFADDVAARVRDAVEKIRAGGSDQMSLADTHLLERQARDLVRKASGDLASGSPVKDQLRRLGGAISGQVDQGVEAAGLGQQWREGNRLYGSLADLTRASEGGYARENAGRFLSPTDHGMAIAGAAALGPKGIALGLVNNGLRKYGNQLAATSLDKLGDLVRVNPAALGRFAAPIASAARRGPAALAAAHYVLSNAEPEYRATMKPILGGE